LPNPIFAHSTPQLYDRYMGPLLFEPYANLVAERCAALQPESILETAAGTGIVTRAVHRAIPWAQIIATDSNSAMLDFAMRALRSEHVLFRHADAQNLPFPGESFDLVLCQFGAMFFPDKTGCRGQRRTTSHRTFTPYFCVIGGTIPFKRRYSTSCP
jgi:ubiquinone/menaquinone biosynthesis C-methylase UbiE